MTEQYDLPIKLSEFLRYPELNPEAVPGDGGGDVTLTEVRMPDFHPVVANIITSLKEATVTVEVLEVFHDIFRLYCRGQLIIDLEAQDDWPDFYEEYLGLNDTE